MKLAELRQRRASLADQLESLVDKPADFERVKKEVVDADATIARMVAASDLARTAARPVGEGGAVVPPPATNENDGFAGLGLDFGRERRAAWTMGDYVAHARKSVGFVPDRERNFTSFGEFLRAVVRASASKGLEVDNRLSRAPIGAGESDASAGGFLVQTDFANAVWTRAYDLGEVLSRVMKLPISANANGIKLPAVDESSRATGSRWGGVSSYWLAEGDAPTASRPKFRLVELDLHKLFSVMYVSDELLQDQVALEAIASQAFSEEIMFMTEDAIWEGDGVGKPFGILNAPALVTVAKDSGQAAATLSLNNITNMWSRMWARSRKNAIWYINQDLEPQLYQLSQVVGTTAGTGIGLPMFMPAGGINNAPYSSLFGRPVIAVEYASTLGTVGDIVLADFSQYVLADKRGMQAATSMHVQFLTDQMTFRFTYRVDGKPIWNVPLTPFKGSNTKSPFIALATRS